MPMTAEQRNHQMLQTAFLTFANIETAIAAHLEARCVVIDAPTRQLLARLRDASGSLAVRLRGELVE